jgi:hypothetical protein
MPSFIFFIKKKFRGRGELWPKQCMHTWANVKTIKKRNLKPPIITIGQLGNLLFRLIILIFFGSIRVLTQGVVLVRQPLYHLRHATSSIIIIIIILQYWGLNSGPHTCKVSILPLKSLPQTPSLIIIFYYSFIHMCVHCLGHFSLLPRPPPSPSLPPTFQAEPVLRFFPVPLKSRNKQ